MTYSLSTLATIVAENGDCRRIRRQSHFSATQSYAHMLSPTQYEAYSVSYDRTNEVGLFK